MFLSPNLSLSRCSLGVFNVDPGTMSELVQQLFPPSQFKGTRTCCHLSPLLPFTSIVLTEAHAAAGPICSALGFFSSS